MAMLSDYKCIKCNTIIEYTKLYGQENFPETIECSCGGTAKRIYKTTVIVPEDFKSVNNK